MSLVICFKGSVPKIILMAVCIFAGCRTPSSKELGEKFQISRRPEDKLAWYHALEQEGHNFSKRVRGKPDSRGVYKFNRNSKLVCLSLRKTDKSGDEWEESLGEDGTIKFKWYRKNNGGIEYEYSAPTNWTIFVNAYQGDVTRYAVKIMKQRLGDDPMPKLSIPDGWRLVEGEKYSGVNIREAYLTFERDGFNHPAPLIKASWPHAGIRAVYGASNIVINATSSSFIPSAKKTPTHFDTTFPALGDITWSLSHNMKGMQAGPHRKVPYPENEIKAVINFVFALREAFERLGFGEAGTIKDGKIWIGGFESNFANGHTDFPAHFHICVNARDGNQVNHFYMDAKTGRITGNCYQDMSYVMDVWDRSIDYYPGAIIPMYDGHAKVSFVVKMLEDGSGFELTIPGKSIIAKVRGNRPCDAVDVLIKENGCWKKTNSYTVIDDCVNGKMTWEGGSFEYNRDTGKFIK